MYSAEDDAKAPGCPIRRSADQRVLSPPRSFSQSATSFIASRCQGIHQMPLSSLEHFPSMRRDRRTHPCRPEGTSLQNDAGHTIQPRPQDGGTHAQQSLHLTHCAGTPVPNPQQKPASQLGPARVRTPTCARRAAPGRQTELPFNRIAWSTPQKASLQEPPKAPAEQPRRSLLRHPAAPSSRRKPKPLHHVHQHRRRSHPARRRHRRQNPFPAFPESSREGLPPLHPAPSSTSKRRMVEPDGIEPTTSCLQSRRSPN